MRMHSANVLTAYRSSDIEAAVARVLPGVPNGSLMIRAAARLAVACVEVLRQQHGRVAGRRVVLLVGEGKNGGDALLAGARLRGRGVRVDALLVDARAYQPGVDALAAAGGAVVDCGTDTGRAAARAAIVAADMVVDGIVGTAGTAGLRPPADELVSAIPTETTVVAVDLPSGVDPDTGETPGTHVHADLTVALSAYTPCLLVPPAAHAAGRLILAQVGVDVGATAEPAVQRLTASGVGARWPVPRREDHKYTRGVLGVVAGSDMYPGAAMLACAGAIRSGVGIVRYIGPARVTDLILADRPEVVAGTGKVQAWLLGSGVEDDKDQEEFVEKALDSGLPCVVDAGALEMCVRRRAAGNRPTPADQVLLTPHAGELARMLTVLGHTINRSEVEARPLHHALLLAKETDATILLKGSTTVVAGPAGPVYGQETGPAWMATAGSGDVLAGIAGTLMAAGISAPETGAMAATVHGRAAARASDGGPIAAADIAEATPATLAELLTPR